LTVEEWRAVPGWEGYYEVSNKGRVRSVERVIEFEDGRVRRFPVVVRSTHTDGFGYFKLTLKRAKRQERILVHQAVAAAWLGPRPVGFDVCHNDGNKTNNAVENLRYDTRAANRADSVRHGTAIRPSMRKLTDEQVAAIRAARGKVTARQLAEMYGTSPAHVCNIQRGNRRAV
jgi:hypothetical protein